MKRVHGIKTHTILGSKLPRYVVSHIVACGFPVKVDKRYQFKRASDAFDGRAWVYVPEANKTFYFDECKS